MQDKTCAMWCWTPKKCAAGILPAELSELPAGRWQHFTRKLGGEIIRVQIGGDDFRSRVVKLFKISDDAAEGVVRRLRFQIANVLADENLIPDGQRDGIFQMRADGEDCLVAADVRRL